MDLWIRSQDKTILEKANQLSIRENNNEYENIDYVIQGCYTLAHYKTKERALEVLDEIQKNIEFQGETLFEVKTGSIKYDRVYIMPKE